MLVRDAIRNRGSQVELVGQACLILAMCLYNYFLFSTPSAIYNAPASVGQRKMCLLAAAVGVLLRVTGERLARAALETRQAE